MLNNIHGLLQTILSPFGLSLIRSKYEVSHDKFITGLAKRGFSPESIVDIGAAGGLWTQSALQHWPNAHYLLIEPLEERREVLDRLSHKYPNVEYLIAGASDQEGNMEFNVFHDQLTRSSFLFGAGEGNGIEGRSVPVVTLDGLLESGQLKQPQFMKLDVQGYEQKVLQGATNVMEKCEMIILELEFFRHKKESVLLHELIAWMAERNFLPYEILGVLRRPYDDAMGQCDIAFLKEDHVLSQGPWE